MSEILSHVLAQQTKEEKPYYESKRHWDKHAMPINEILHKKRKFFFLEN